jgi:hypothetical protein
VLWRVMKLARLATLQSDRLAERVIEPFLALYTESDELACVPHYSVQNRRAMRAHFERCVGRECVFV